MKKNDRLGRMAKAGACVALAGALVVGSLGIGKGFVLGRSVSAAETGRVTLERLSSEEAGERTKGYLDVVDIVEDAMPSVVSITTKSVQEIQDYYDIFGIYGYAPNTKEYEVTGGGSGIIIGRNDEELLVVTNYHVVQGANQVAVCFVDNNAYKGIVKGYDREKDVAVLAVKASELKQETLEKITIAKIGSSDDLRVGEQVVLIGNAMGYGQSVTTGIVSAKNRKMDENGNATTEGVNLIQTDAAINPGNSGGAMLNMDGEVVGINSSKLSGTVIEGMCYAIAISDVEDAIIEMMNEETREKVSGVHGALGITASTVSDRENQLYGIPLGAIVVEVSKGSGAEKAGLKSGYIVTKFQGRSVSGVEDLVERLEYYAPGEEVTVTAAVRDGDTYTEKEFTVTLQKAQTQGTTEEKEQEQEQKQNEGSQNPFEDWFFRGWGNDGEDDGSFFRGWGQEDPEQEEEEEELEPETEPFGQGTFGDWQSSRG